MKRNVVTVLIIVFLTTDLSAQFTVIPTGTNTIIRSMDFDADTLIILGNQNYFAKSPDLGESIDVLPMSLPTHWVNLHLQEVDGMYYFMAGEVLPSTRHVIKSSDRGQSWNNLFTVNGVYSNLTMIDTSFGVMGGGANYAVTYGNDIWTIDSAFSGTTTASSFYGDSTILFLTLDGFSYITMNQSTTWDWGYCNNVLHQTIQFINKDTVYSIGYSGDDSDFSYSYDQGQNFNNIWLGYNDSTSQRDYHSRVRDMYFDSPDHGYIFGYMLNIKVDNFNYPQVNESVIFETYDGGQTWIPYLTGYSDEFYSHVAYNDSISFIGGDNGLLLKWNRNIPLTNPVAAGTSEYDKKLSVYPNPFTDFTEINLEGIEFPIQLELFDQTGRLIRTERIESSKHILKRGSLTAGVYYYKLGKIKGKLIVSD